MEKIAVFVDDAEHAAGVLAPLLAGRGAGVEWVVVGCAPKLTHRIGKWASNASRMQWREHWVRALRARLEPVLAQAGVERCEWQLARGPLDATARSLRQRLGADLRLLDARRPKLGVVAEPLTPDTPVGSRWTAPVALGTGVSLMLALTD